MREGTFDDGLDMFVFVRPDDAVRDAFECTVAESEHLLEGLSVGVVHSLLLVEGQGCVVAFNGVQELLILDG